MPRRKTTVKCKKTKGLVDIHFHGAFGVDFMRASFLEMDELARHLWNHGIAGFCPTTLSCPAQELRATVQRIGQWIESYKKNTPTGAIPLGIHLEGPFINPQASGAHPADVLRLATLEELEDLWIASAGNLKIITLAPEVHSQQTLQSIIQWSKKNRIVLSLGHSAASELQAHEAFKLGFSHLTHAWNACSFHHRSPGPLGAALGNPNAYLELIMDGVHVSPTVLRWSLNLHPIKKICFVSDCVPSAGLPVGKTTFFGSMPIQTLNDGASYQLNKTLAGGGRLLSDSYCHWLEHESKIQKIPLEKLFSITQQALTLTPLVSLGFHPMIYKKFKVKRDIIWEMTPQRICLKSC